MRRLNTLEILLLEIVIYLALWFLNDYLGALLSAIFGGIILLILLVSLIVEWVERSKVPRWYFQLMAASVIAPVIASLVYLLINGFPDWSI